MRRQQCVVNLASDNMTFNINALARTTGTPVVPAGKLNRGYWHVKDKYGVANLTPQSSTFVAPPRIKECPAQMEAKLCGDPHKLLTHTLGEFEGQPLALEVQILKTYVTDELRLTGYENRIDADRWRPMIMSFQNLYGLRDGKRVDSTLAGIEEELYRMPLPNRAYCSNRY